jgi:endonuclease III
MNTTPSLLRILSRSSLSSLNMKRSRSPSLSPLSSPPPLAVHGLVPNELTPSPQKSKKLQLLDAYATVSPYPDYPRPTPAEALEIHNILNPDKTTQSLKKSKSMGNSAQTCGATPDVLDALVGTILSQNTSNANSTRAKHTMDATFGHANWIAIASAPREQLVESLRSGGLANKKAKVIQGVLASVYERHGSYSLQHLANPSVSKDTAMQELVSYDGVGPKTAACVLMFSLQRSDAFAVDTHVYRLSRLLEWVPRQADRVMAQAHLEAKIPDEVKYGIHVGMIRHGKSCRGCREGGSLADKNACVLRSWLRNRQKALGEKCTEKDLDTRVDEVQKVATSLEVKSIKEEESDIKPQLDDVPVPVGQSSRKNKKIKVEQDHDIVKVGKGPTRRPARATTSKMDDIKREVE